MKHRTVVSILAVVLVCACASVQTVSGFDEAYDQALKAQRPPITDVFKHWADVYAVQ